MAAKHWALLRGVLNPVHPYVSPKQLANTKGMHLCPQFCVSCSSAIDKKL